MAGLAVALVDAHACLCGSTATTAATTASGGGFELEHRGPFFGGDVDPADGGIGGDAAPVGSTVIAGDLHGVREGRGREESEIAGVGDLGAEAFALLCVGDVRVDVVRFEDLPGVGRRHGGEGLRRPGFFAGDVGFGNLALFDGPDGFAGYTVENEEETLFGGLDDGVDILAVVLDGEELGGRDEVVVPEVVVGGLEVPQVLAGAGVEGKDAIGKEVGSFAVGTVEVIGGGAEGEVGDAAFFVDGDFPPGVDAANPFVCVFRPGVVAHFAGVGDGVEGPHEFACAGVVGAEVAGGRFVFFAGGGTEDEEVFEDAAGVAGLDAAHGVGVATEADAEVDFAVITEAHDGFAGAGVEGLQHVAGGEEDAAVGCIFGLPVGDAAVGDGGFGIAEVVGPEEFAGGSVEGGDGVVEADDVHAPVNDGGVEAVAEAVVAGGVKPGLAELADVGFVDLFEGGVLG